MNILPPKLRSQIKLFFCQQSSKFLKIKKFLCIFRSFTLENQDMECVFQNIHTHFFYKQRIFSTQPRCWLTFLWIKVQILFRYCLIHISIIIMRHFRYLLYLCPWLDLCPFMLHLCDLFLIFIFIFIMINPVISWIQTHLVFCLFFKNISHYFSMITWMKNE